MTSKHRDTHSNTRGTYSPVTHTIRTEGCETDNVIHNDTDTDAVPAAVTDPGEHNDEADQTKDEDEDEEIQVEPDKPVALFSPIRRSNIKSTSSRNEDGRQNVHPSHKVYLMKKLDLNRQSTEPSNSLTAVSESKLAPLEIQGSRNANIFRDRLDVIGLQENILKDYPKTPFIL